MISKSDVIKLHETILSMPGMNEKVKMDFKISLRSVFILSKVIDRGLSIKEVDGSVFNILDLISPDLNAELLNIPGEILEKAGLTEMNEKLKGFSDKRP